MIIDRSKKLTKIVAILCCISTLFEIYKIIGGFVWFRLIMLLVSAAVAFVCIKDAGKDREILAASFSVMAIYAIIQIFNTQSMTLLSALLRLVNVFGYIAVLAYIFELTPKKLIPVLGATAILFIDAKNIYNIIVALRNLNNSMGGKALTVIKKSASNIVGVIGYMVPIASMIPLIMTDTIRFAVGEKNNVPAESGEPKPVEIQREEPEVKERVIRHRHIGKKAIVACVCVAVLAAAAAVVMSIYNSPIRKFDRALRDQDTKAAQTVYEENVKKDDFVNEANERLYALIEGIKIDYIQEKISEEQARQDLREIGRMISIDETIKDIEKISNSKNAFSDAEKAEKDKDFILAISEYKKVIEQDSINYELVDERIEKAKAGYINKTLEDSKAAEAAGRTTESIRILKDAQNTDYTTSDIDLALFSIAQKLVDDCAKTGNYSDTYDILGKISLSEKTDELNALKSKVVELASESVITQANKLMSAKKNNEAYIILKNTDSRFVTDKIESVLRECKRVIAKDAVDEASALMSEEKYAEAYKVLTAVKSDVVTAEVTAAKENCVTLFRKTTEEESARLADKGDYDGAMKSIDAYLKVISDTLLKNKKEEYRVKKLESEQLITVIGTRIEDSYIYNLAYVTVKNNTDKVVKGYVVAMIMLDKNGYPVNNEYKYQNFDGYTNVYGGKTGSANIQPGAKYGSNVYWMLVKPTKKIMACVVSAEFYDGTTWLNEYYSEWVKMYAEKPIIS